MKEYKTKPLALLAAVMAALLALSGCAAGGDAAPAQAGPQAIEVHTTTAGYGTIDRQTQFVGRVEAAESVKVYATTSAKVITANGALGERVEKGQLLFALDTEMLEIAAETARLQYEAAVSGADISITSAKHGYDDARDGYVDLWEAVDEADSARSVAASALTRAEAAYNDAKARYYAAKEAREDAEKQDEEAPGSVDPDALFDLREAEKEALRLYSAAETAYTSAAAAKQGAEAQYEALKDQMDGTKKTVSRLRETYRNTAGDDEAGIVGTAQSQVDLARINYDNAVKNLGDARVYAPVSGVISAKSISASDFASPGMPLYVIEPEGDAPMVSFNLSEDGANALSVGSPVTVVYSGAEYPARITELANTANPQTGLYAAKAQTDEPLPTSRSGGVVKVKASTAKAEDALLLSLDLVEYDGNQPYVYVYRNGTAVRVDVVTGISSADDVVILSGIGLDDRIITTWHPDLKDGAAVILAE